MCDVDWPILHVEGRCVQMKKKYIKRYFRMEPDLVNEMDEFCLKTKLLKTLGPIIKFTKPPAVSSSKRIDGSLHTCTLNLLKKICNKIYYIHECKNDEADDEELKKYDKVILKENKIVKNIADGKTSSGGTVSRGIGSLDDELFEAFTTNKSELFDSKRFSKTNVVNEYIPELTNGLSKETPGYIINNALSTGWKDNDENIRLINQLINKSNNKLVQYCPITSVIDAMGTFGYCSSGQNSTNYTNNNYKIKIQGDELEFNMVLQSKSKKTYILIYYITWNKTRDNSDDIEDKNEPIYTNSEVKFNISNQSIKILSANAVYERVLDILDLMCRSIAPVSEPLIRGNDLLDSKLDDIINVLSNKAFGDIGQELDALSKEYIGQDKTKEKIKLLATGDRPSFIRTAMIYDMCLNVATGTPLAENKSNMNEKIKIFYTTESGGKINSWTVPKKMEHGGSKKTRKYKIKKRKTKRKRVKNRTFKRKQKMSSKKTLRRRKKTMLRKYI